MQEDSHPITEVEDILWEEAPSGNLMATIKTKQIPRCFFSFYYVNGYDIEHVYDNNIGPGAKIQVQFVGSLNFPYVCGVVKKCENMKILGLLKYLLQNFQNKPEAPFNANTTKILEGIFDKHNLILKYDNFFQFYCKYCKRSLLSKKLLDNFKKEEKFECYRCDESD